MGNKSIAIRALEEAKIHLSDIPYYQDLSIKENHNARVLAFKKNFQSWSKHISEAYFYELLSTKKTLKLGKHLGELVLYKTPVFKTDLHRKSIVNWEETMKKGKRVLSYYFKTGVWRGNYEEWDDEKHVIIRLKYVPPKEANPDIMKKYYRVQLTSPYKLLLKELFSREDKEWIKNLLRITCSFKLDYDSYKEEILDLPRFIAEKERRAKHKKYYKPTKHWRMARALANRTITESSLIDSYKSFLC